MSQDVITPTQVDLLTRPSFTSQPLTQAARMPATCTPTPGHRFPTLQTRRPVHLLD